MPFSDEEKARIKHHLSYPDWQQLSNSIQLGFPSGAQPLFLVEQAFQRLSPGGEDAVRRDLCECEDIEKQMSEARRRMKASRLGNLHINHDETAMLRGELNYWVLKMASDLGVVTNPYAVAEYDNIRGGGANARVMT